MPADSTLCHGTEACPVNSAMRHALQFAVNRAFFKYSVPFPKTRTAKYFGMWTVEEQISARKS